MYRQMCIASILWKLKVGYPSRICESGNSLHKEGIPKSFVVFKRRPFGQLAHQVRRAGSLDLVRKSSTKLMLYTVACYFLIRVGSFRPDYDIGALPVQPPIQTSLSAHDCNQKQRGIRCVTE